MCSCSSWRFVVRRRIDPEQQKRHSTGRAIIKLMRNAPNIFDSGDDVLFVQEDSRLGMWIGVKPTRHVELFEQLATKYFKGFEMHRHSAGDREWVRFGYEYNGRVPTEITEANEKAKNTIGIYGEWAVHRFSKMKAKLEDVKRRFNTSLVGVGAV